MAVSGVRESPFGVDCCPTRTYQWRRTLPVRGRTVFGQLRSFDIAG